MDSKKVGYNSIDEYIAAFPEDVQAILQAIRATVQAAAPDATEKISYQMPTISIKLSKKGQISREWLLRTTFN